MCFSAGRRLREAAGSGTDVDRTGLMLWDLIQHYQISQLDNKIDAVRDGTSRDTMARDATSRLEKRVDAIALVTQALFELLQESSGISEARLREKITEIDLRDGQADGKMTPRPKKCPKCDAMMSPKFGRCLFCGENDRAPRTL